jgi:hypothetical protein
MTLNLNYIEYSEVNSFDIRKNGIQVVIGDKDIEIYNDPFRTVPVFIVKNDTELIVFSNFEDFYKMGNVGKVVDEVGFWEVVLFGSGLWTRTYYKDVKQMPGASKIVINKKTCNFKIARYWDFDIVEDQSIDSIEKAANGMYKILNNLFSKIDKNNKYTMGLSGGLDSRITLAFLSKYIPKENLSLFTFGFNKKSVEYTYAIKVAKALGYYKPTYHNLDKNSYKKALNYLPLMSGGLIGINHCHIMDVLDNIALNDRIQISTYYTDALFGYECTTKKSVKDVDDNYYTNLLAKYSDDIPVNIAKEIIKDAKMIYSGFHEDYNFSSLDEYKYLTERSQKFHFHLSYLQGLHGKFAADSIYADYDLLKYTLSIPIKYRAQKKMIDFIINNKFKNIASKEFKNISSRDFNGKSIGFAWSNKLLGMISWYTFRFINLLNVFFRVITRGHFQLFNKYQTEELDRILYRDFQEDLRCATERFVKIGLMSAKQKKHWDKLPYRSVGINERFSLISLGKLPFYKSQ